MQRPVLPKNQESNALIKIAKNISKTAPKDEDKLKAIGVIIELTDREREEDDYGISEIKKKAMERLF